MPKPARADSAPMKIVEDFKRRPLWWREIVYVLVLYGLYSVVRNVQGAALSVSEAFRNADQIVRLEKAMGIFNEKQIQDAFLHYPIVVRVLNIYYGTAHFVVTIGVLLWLFHVQKDRYHQWRNVIFATSGVALIGYMLYPLAPPRFLSDPQFVDTLKVHGGWLSFENESVQQVSNQYAAMPSLHVAWALWSAFAVMPVLRHWWTKVLIGLYPALTILTIVVTGNHYWADVVGGALVFAVGFLIAGFVERRQRQYVHSRTEADATIEVTETGPVITVPDQRSAGSE